MSAARIWTGIVLAGLGVLVVMRRSATTTQPATPQDTVYVMFEAARAGDVNKYLEQYAAPLADLLRQTVTPRYLREANGPVKGIAVNEPRPVNERAVTVQVELVYQDRNEAQTYHLEKQGSQWKIVRLDAAERVKPTVPYGSAAN
jgi:hypothetical protein